MDERRGRGYRSPRDAESKPTLTIRMNPGASQCVPRRLDASQREAMAASEGIAPH